MTRITSIADWAHSVQRHDIPDRVIELCRVQRRSVLGGIAASTGDAASGRVASVVDDPLYRAAALSIALDFDDYVCFGHTGHSAVIVSLAIGAQVAASGTDQLVAQVVANEVEARLGGTCLIGPLNGQLWSFIHAAGAALAAGRLLELNRDKLAHALAIALYQAPRPTVPGFMAPDSKLLTAAEPMVMGVRAALLAAAGVTGPLDVLDRRDGFLGAFADAPIPGLLGGLGVGWATDTLCVKPYPGCAYVDTVLDAIRELGAPALQGTGPIDISASLLTCEMDAMSAPYATAPTPVTVNFSVGWNVAIAAVAGEVTPRQVNEVWLSAHRAELEAVRSRVVLQHDWALTRAASEQFAALLPPGRIVADAGAGKLSRGLRRARSHHPSAIGWRDLLGARELLRSRRQTGALARRRFWDPDALASFAMTFPVVVRAGDATARVDTPRGGAGHPSEGPDLVAAQKLRTWGEAAWGRDATATIEAAINADDPKLWSLVEP